MSQTINGTNGGTAATVLAANGARRGFFFNADKDCWLNFHGTAAVDAGILLKTGTAGYVFDAGAFPVRNAVSLMAVAADCKFQIIEMLQVD